PALIAAEASGPGSGATSVTFDQDPLGRPPATFEAVVGNWAVTGGDGARGLMGGGSRWRPGAPSGNPPEQARRLYVQRYAEFLDGVKGFAYLPLTVYTGDCASDQVALSVRFLPQAGRIDQSAGIAWGIAPDGSYLAARASALEDNLLLVRVARGQRATLDTVGGVQTASRTWHTLQVTQQGRALSVSLDGQELLKRTLDPPPPGRCGLWSEGDSQVLFDDFTVGTPR